jgi:hypothetical protein
MAKTYCWGKGSIIPVPEFIFTASCKIHDENYWIGWNEIDRITADTWFLKYMLVDCMRYEWLRRAYYVIWAYTYFYAVRIFWGSYFNYYNK